MSWLLVLVLAYIQNIAFALVSRARNRDSYTYHAVCSVLSNGIWFLTMKQLVVSDLSLMLLLPYVVGTVAGSMTGQHVSIKIEKLIGAKT
jgi:hypothetical protein